MGADSPVFSAAATYGQKNREIITIRDKNFFITPAKTIVRFHSNIDIDFAQGDYSKSNLEQVEK